MENVRSSHGEDKSRNNQSNVGAKIGKVPEKLIKSVSDRKNYYSPSVVSIGPYHHGATELQEAEKLKPKIAEYFTKVCVKVSERDLKEKVAKVADEAREHYEELDNSTIGFDEAFKEMLFLDGCFVLHYFLCKILYKLSPILNQEMWAHVWQDLFLLENQLPIKVLDALLDFKISTSTLFGVFIKQTRPFIPHTNLFLSSRSPIHLLDCLHMQLAGEWCDPQNSSPSLPQDREKGNWYSCRSVNEIKATGVHFRSTKMSNLRAVKFERGLISGTIRLPQLLVNDSTKTILLNLIVFESCSNTQNDHVVSSYVSFMSTLISHVDDVKELRSKDILLGIQNDQHVVNMFNEIGYGLVPNPNLYVDVRKQIEKQSREKWKIWIKDWRVRNFKTPWTFLGFIAAIYVIILTTVQTYFAMYPPKKN